MYWYLPFAWTFAFFEELAKPVSLATTEMATGDIDAAAELHAEAFAHPWSGDEFASLLSQAGTFGYVVRRPGVSRPTGFVLARLTVDEGEILTIAVDPAARGRGLGRQLMDRVLERLHAERALSLYLEVDDTNRSALTLYRRLRFEEVGRRPAYYVNPDGTRSSALVMKRTLA